VIIFTLGISILTDFKRCVLKNACVINVIIKKRMMTFSVNAFLMTVFFTMAFTEFNLFKIE